jgi:hypothetical protein
MTEQSTPERPRRRRGAVAAALAIAALAVAVPASGALAGGDDGSASGSPGTEQRTIPAQDGGQSRDRDCPEKDGRGNGGGQSSGGGQSNDTGVGGAV